GGLVHRRLPRRDGAVGGGGAGGGGALLLHPGADAARLRWGEHGGLQGNVSGRAGVHGLRGLTVLREIECQKAYSVATTSRYSARAASEPRRSGVRRVWWSGSSPM